MPKRFFTLASCSSLCAAARLYQVDRVSSNQVSLVLITALSLQPSAYIRLFLTTIPYLCISEVLVTPSSIPIKSIPTLICQREIPRFPTSLSARSLRSTHITFPSLERTSNSPIKTPEDQSTGLFPPQPNLPGAKS